MKLLVINPNTTDAVTSRLVDAVRDEAAPGCDVHGITARFGARYISSEASYAIAAHAVLDAWAAHCERHGAPDAVLIGCFGDPGLWALRECSSAPVVGLAEAAMREAAALGRFSIVAGSAASEPRLRRLALALGLDGALAGLERLAPGSGVDAAEPQATIARLRDACARAAGSGQVRGVVLGGAGLAGMAAEVARGLAVPLIDSVSAGARALVRAAGGRGRGVPPSAPSPAIIPWAGLSPELTQALG